MGPNPNSIYPNENIKQVVYIKKSPWRKNSVISGPIRAAGDGK